MNFVSKVNPTIFQQAVSQALGLDLICLSGDDCKELKDMTLTTKYSIPRGGGGPKARSIQRKLVNSVIYDLSSILNKKGNLLDVAGIKAYGKFLGFKQEDIFSLNIFESPEIDYVESAEGNCSSVPRNHFDNVICLAYLLLAQNPQKVVDNIYEFLKPGGIAILDFIGLTYWYIASDGYHYHTYVPGTIHELLKNKFSDYVIIPAGTWVQATFNYYAKRCGNRYIEYLLFRIGEKFSMTSKYPKCAMHWITIAKK